MAVSGEPPDAGLPGTDWRVRIERLEASQLRSQRVLLGLALGTLIVLGWLCIRVEQRASSRRADTLFAQRFVLEHEGRPRAELSMHPAGFAQLLLGPDDRYEHGVAIGSRGEVNVRGRGGSGITMFGSQMTVLGNRGVLRAAIEPADRGLSLWVVDSTGTGVFALTPDGVQRRTGPASAQGGP